MIYLFVLSPPYQGSTILYKLLHTSPNISTLISPLNPSHVGEGCALFNHGSRFEIENFSANRFNPSFDMPMNRVKAAFETVWNPSKRVMCDKSPPTIVRAKQFEEHFSKFGKVYFITLIRDPLACRYDLNRWSEFAKYQIGNIKGLQNVLSLTYEELVANPNKTANRIIRFLPELGKLNPDVGRIVGIKNIDCKQGNRNTKIQNCNTIRNYDQKIKQLTPEIKEQLIFFNYSIDEASRL